MTCCCIFPIFFSKFWPRGNAVWHICLFQGSNTNFQLTSYISWCSQTFIKKLFTRQCGLTHIVLSRALYEFPPKLVLKCLLKTASGTLRFDQKIVSGTICFDPYCLFKDINIHPMLIYFLMLKIYWKIVSGTAWFDRYFPF